MSRQRSLEQERARAAWAAIKQVKQSNERLEEQKRYAKEYGSLARSAPADIQANGLGQTLAFWRAKGYADGKPKPDDAHAVLLEHVANWLRERKILPRDKDPVVWISENATTGQYRCATAEAIAFLIWLRRFAEAELPRKED